MPGQIIGFSLKCPVGQLAWPVVAPWKTSKQSLMLVLWGEKPHLTSFPTVMAAMTFFTASFLFSFFSLFSSAFSSKISPGEEEGVVRKILHGIRPTEPSQEDDESGQRVKTLPFPESGPLR